MAKRTTPIADWKPGRWYSVVAPDGSLWCETSSPAEAKESMRLGDTLYRLYERIIHDSMLRRVSDEDLEVSIQSENKFYGS